MCFSRSLSGTLPQCSLPPVLTSLSKIWECDSRWAKPFNYENPWCKRTGLPWKQDNWVQSLNAEGCPGELETESEHLGGSANPRPLVESPGPITKADVLGWHHKHGNTATVIRGAYLGKTKGPSALGQGCLPMTRQPVATQHTGWEVTHTVTTSSLLPLSSLKIISYFPKTDILSPAMWFHLNVGFRTDQDALIGSGWATAGSCKTTSKSIQSVPGCCR